MSRPVGRLGLSHGLQKSLQAKVPARATHSARGFYLSRSSPAAQGCACPGFESGAVWIQLHPIGYPCARSRRATCAGCRSGVRATFKPGLKGRAQAHQAF